MALDKPTFDQIITLLLPYTQHPDDRYAWIEAALYGCAVLPQISWTGQPVPSPLH